MIFDIFFSICQTEVKGFIPSEREMLLNFYDQVKCADDLGYDTAWVAETHLSCQVQKLNKNPVIPKFEGEIGLNTDILQTANRIFATTKNINVGSAIRNIFCNGGPIAHAEAIKTFLMLHSLDENEKRILNIGFASGRFQFSNSPYGIVPRNDLEEAAWPVVKGKIFYEATEIFLRFLKGEIFSSDEVSPKFISKKDFRTPEAWQKVLDILGDDTVEKIEIPSYWKFEKVGVIPYEAPLNNLRLTIGSHDHYSQIHANKFYPCGVFNLSITPTKEIEETHERMKVFYHSDGGEWNRSLMPRTVLVFINNDPTLTPEQQRIKANETAREALENYWKAIEGTLDPLKIQNAVNNALIGNSGDLIEQIKERFHPDDRLMLWFDFNNHNNEEIKNNMKMFMQDVASNL